MSPRKPQSIPACILCGNINGIENHHIGGRNHLAWVTIPLCRKHHRQCHALLENAEVDLNHTADSHERLIRASKAITIFLCLVQIEMHHLVRKS